MEKAPVMIYYFLLVVIEPTGLSVRPETYATIEQCDARIVSELAAPKPDSYVICMPAGSKLKIEVPAATGDKAGS